MVKHFWILFILDIYWFEICGSPSSLLALTCQTFTCPSVVVVVVGLNFPVFGSSHEMSDRNSQIVLRHVRQKHEFRIVTICLRHKITLIPHGTHFKLITHPQAANRLYLNSLISFCAPNDLLLNSVVNKNCDGLDLFFAHM